MTKSDQQFIEQIKRDEGRAIELAEVTCSNCDGHGFAIWEPACTSCLGEGRVMDFVYSDCHHSVEEPNTDCELCFPETEVVELETAA